MMAIDPKMKEAIEDVVDTIAQPETVAKRLIAWIEQIVSGNEDINDKQFANRHLELLYDAIVVDDEIED